MIQETIGNILFSMLDCVTPRVFLSVRAFRVNGYRSKYKKGKTTLNRSGQE